MVVDEGITLDLAGFALKVDYMVCYGAIIDSSAGTAGILQVPANHLVMEDTNPQLPVKDGEGYRFVEIIGYNSTMVNENKYAFQPLFEADAHQYLASGTAASGVSIQVDVTWKQNGNTIHAYFSYSDDLVKGYVDSYKPESGKYGKMFTLTKQSTGYYEDLGFEAIVVSESDVRIGAGISKPVTPDDGKVEVDSNNQVVNDVTIYDSMGSATIQAGTQLEDASAELKLNAKPMDTTGTDITLSNGEEMQSFDVHVSGISKDNTVPVIITLKELAPEFLNKGNLDLYHVENGVTVPMTRVYTLEEVDAHNEYYYDIATGTVTLAMATFSEISARSVTANPWKGEVDHTWYVANATELTIANADQLWSFSQIVGGMAVINGKKVQDSFEGKTVKLIADINLADDEVNNDPNKVFYPIGYYNSEYTYEMTGTKITSGVTAFQGTFDGQGHTIKNFYQSTWEMKGDDPYYAASEQRYNDAMGLFSATFNATVKNLVIEKFSCDGEFTPTGCVVAYAGGNSTFENITLRSCNPRVYNTGNGGIVGLNYCSTNGTADQLTFKNITVDNTNKITALWGSWDVACGGIVGRIRENSKHDGTNTVGQMNTVSFENCHVAAQIDVYNDVCANYQYYQYRYSGMMVGTIDYMDEIPGVSLKDMFSATGCTVHFGEWNTYWYCELVENSLASYTHDHQFSRLEKITNVKDIQDANGNWNRAGNFVIPAENEADAVCYHIRNVNGEFKQHKHEEAGFEKTLPSSYDPAGYKNWDDDDELELLLEDRQHYMLPFQQMCAGYGWGASHEYLWGDAINGGIIVLDYENPESVTKFTAVSGSGASYDSGVTVKIGDLFAAVEGLDKLAIDVDNVEVTVSPADDNSTASGTYTANDEDWTEGTLTFSGVGSAQIIIQDYYFCVPTYLTLNIRPAVKLELVSHPVNTYTDLNDTTHAEGTKAYVQLSSEGELPLVAGSSVDVDVPDGWTFKSDIGTYADGKLTVTNAQTVSKENLVLGTFVIAQPDKDITGWTVDATNLKVMGAKSAVPAVVTLTAQGEGHNGDEWIAWGDDEAELNRLPEESGKYYLTTNLVLDNQASLIGNKNVTLCLNGKTIKANANIAENSKLRDRAFSVQYGSILTVCDCTACGDWNNGIYDEQTNQQGYKAGKITGCAQGALMIPHITSLNTNLPAHSNSVINLYDGILTENVMQTDSATLLAQDGGTVNMYGGLITGNYNSKGGAGAFCGGDGSTFNLYAGIISNNAAGKGAGLWVAGGHATVHSGVKIINNRTWQDLSDQYCLLPGETSEYDPNISYDATTIGKAETVTVDGKTYTFSFDYDPATNSYGAGAGIYVSHAKLTMSGVEVSGNTAWFRGGAIYTYNAELDIKNSHFENNKTLTYKYEWSVPSAPPSDNTTNGTQDQTQNQTPDQPQTVDETGGDVDGGTESGGNSGGSDMGGETTTTGSWQIKSVTGAGGAVYLNKETEGTFENTQFINNDAAANGGGMVVTVDSNVTLKNLTMTDNKIHRAGGAALYIAGGATCVIDGGEITNNIGDSDLGVGGIYIPNNYSKVTLSGSPVITGNGRKNGDVFFERNIFLQDNGNRYSSTYNEYVPDAILRIRNLTPGTCFTVYSSRKGLGSDLSKWLNWKDETGFDPENRETYYGTWSQTYIRNNADSLKHYVILEDAPNYNLYLTDDHSIHHGDDSYEWYAWGDDTDEDGLPTKSGYYYLTKDVSLDTAQQLNGTADVTLCLAGHSVTANGERIYDVKDTAKLTICDCTVAAADAESQATVGTLYTGTGEGGAIRAESGTTVKLENIQITGKRGDTQVSAAGNGGAIWANGATIDMQFVRIANVHTVTNGGTTGDGGAIYATGKNIGLTMTNVTIENCSGAFGGAVMFKGYSDGAATGTLAMTNVTIQGCVADGTGTERYGEVLYIYGTKSSVLDSCNIVNNTNASTIRGIVYLAQTTTVMKDCTITGNKFENYSTYSNFGAIYMTSSGKLVLDGNNNYIYDNLTPINSDKTQKKQANIYLQANSDATVGYKYPQMIFRNITDDNYIAAYVTLERYVDSNTSHNVNGFVPYSKYLTVEPSCTKQFTILRQYVDNELRNESLLYNLATEGEQFVLCDGNHPGLADYHKDDDCADSEWKAWTSTDSVPDENGHYYLTQDVTVTAKTEITSARNITICLNGHNISYSSNTEIGKDTEAYDDVLYYMKNAEINLTICDCTAGGDKTLGVYGDSNPNGYKAGTISDFTDGVLFTPSGSNIDNRNVTINIRDGIFRDNYNDSSINKDTNEIVTEGATGGVIIAQKGTTVNITGGLFTGNKAYVNAAVVYASNATVSASKAVFSHNTAETGDAAAMNIGATMLTLTECTFISNTAANNGGAICLRDNTGITVIDCTFTSNTATNNGGVIYLNNNTNVTVTNCTFTENSAEKSGGAIYVDKGTSTPEVTLDNCSFQNNNAKSNGGAIYTQAGLVAGSECEARAPGHTHRRESVVHLPGSI